MCNAFLGLLLFSCACLTTTLSVVGSASAETPAATLRFSTACSGCHEGECSGRVTFSQRPEATYTHIRQHAGPTDDALAQELHGVLKRMKRDCSYPPLPVPDIEQPLAGTDINPYLDPWTGHYFVPLGSLDPGRYRFSLVFAQPGDVRIELVDADFDFLVDRCETLGDLRLEMVLTLNEPCQCYLRLRPRAKQRLTKLSVTGIN